jgi:protein SCO1/2
MRSALLSLKRSGLQRGGIKLTVALLLVFVVIIVGGFVHTMLKPRVLSPAALRANNAFVFERPRDIGEFNLIDDNGQPFTSAQLRGKWSLLFFGYTYCPDICPTSMVLLNQFYAKLKPELAGDTQIIFVSVDPARDDVAKLHEYVRYFNPQFRGVTGEFMALQQFATALSIPFAKVPGGGDNYQIEHSGSIAIINSQGHYVGFLKAPHELDKLLTNYPSIHAQFN